MQQLQLFFYYFLGGQFTLAKGGQFEMAKEVTLVWRVGVNLRGFSTLQQTKF